MDAGKGRPMSSVQQGKLKKNNVSPKLISLTHEQYLETNKIDELMRHAMLELLVNKPQCPLHFLANYFEWIESKSNPLEKAYELLTNIKYTEPMFEQQMCHAYTVLNQCKVKNDLQGLTGETYVNLIRMLLSDLNVWEASRFFENMFIGNTEVICYNIFRSGILCSLKYKNFLKVSKMLYSEIDVQQSNEVERSTVEKLIRDLMENDDQTDKKIPPSTKYKILLPPKEKVTLEEFVSVVADLFWTKI